MTAQEKLARWLHGANCRLNTPKAKNSAWKDNNFHPTWDQLDGASPQGKKWIMTVAAELLANPPQVLIDAITEKAK